MDGKTELIFTITIGIQWGSEYQTSLLFNWYDIQVIYEHLVSRDDLVLGKKFRLPVFFFFLKPIPEY